MENFLVYIVQCAACLAVLYLPFRLWLRKEACFHANRYVLLGMTVLSFILPLLRLPWLMQETIIRFPETFIVGQLESAIESHFSISWIMVAMCLYLSGSICLLIRKIHEWVCLKRFIPRGCIWTHEEDNIHIYCHTHPVAPFSWMNQIVISEEDYQANGHAILLHEKGHIHCRHTWDMIWISCVQVVQWFNPFVWLLSKDMQDIHEYEADRWTIDHGQDRMAYQMLLIERGIKQPSFPLTNHFRNGMTRKRIQMMNQHPSSSRIRMRYIYLFPIAVFVVGLLSPKAEIIKEEFSDLPPEVFQYIARHSKYPTSAIQKGIQGEVVLQMSLDGEGELKALEVVKSVDDLLDTEALRVVQDMPKWKAGNGGITRYLISLTFSLQSFKPGRLKEIASTLDEEDNPVIMLMKQKGK